MELMLSNVKHKTGRGHNMRRKYISIIISVLFLVSGIYIAGRIHLSMQFSEQVKSLYADAGISVSGAFTYRQLEGLPLPVQRYFRHVLKEGQQYPETARIRHSGTFKTGFDKEWTAITGEQYYTLKKPGFIWKGEASMFTARDMFLHDKGSLKVTLFSLVNIVDAKGPEYDQGELLRWLGECIWFPAALLPGEYISWSAAGSSTAMLNMKYRGLSVYYKVSFNERDEISRMETKRYMDGSRLETWIGVPSDYREINGTVIPVQIEGAWNLDTGYFAYARFKLEEIEYNRPEKF